MSSGGEKTEAPTARRLSKAREDGQVARSTDLNGAIVLGAFCLLLTSYGAYAGGLLQGMMQQVLSLPYKGPMSITAVFALLANVGETLILVLLPAFGTVYVAALGSNLIQVSPKVSFKPLMPDLKKLNPIEGVKRVWSMRSVIELVKGLLKMAVVGSVGYAVINSDKEALLNLLYTTPDELGQIVLGMALKLTFSCFLAYLLLGILDFAYQKYEFIKRLRMSKQDIKDESKNSEGNLQMKGQQRQMGRAMMMKQQLAKVPTADVIITNPTHYAVAIRYDPDIAPAPHVVAKGVDHFALKIREVATENRIDIIENKPLARTLYASVEPGEMIPPDLFIAVAEVLAFVYKKNKGRGKQHFKRRL